MKRFLIFFAVILTVWFIAKALGLTGRQFRAGQYDYTVISMTELDQPARVEIKSTTYGIHGYDLTLRKDGKRIPKSHGNIDLTMDVNIFHCESRKPIKQEQVKLYSGERPAHYDYVKDGDGLDGRLIRPRLWNRWRQVCLETQLAEVRTGALDGIDLEVQITDRRPCWFIECLLD